MANAIASANSIVDDYADDIARMLGLTAITKPTIVIGSPEGGLASTDGNIITISPQLFRKNPDPTGVLVHEIVHAMQNIQDPNVPDDVKEAMASAIRLKLTGDVKDWDVPPDELTKQYAKLRPWQFQALNAIVQSGQYAQLDNKGVVEGIVSGAVPRDQWEATVNNGNVTPDKKTVIPGTNMDAATLSQYLGGPGTAQVTGGGVDPNNKPTTDPGKGNDWAYINGQWTIVPSVGGNNQHHNAIQNAEASFTGLLQSYGIDVNSNMQNLINTAAAHNWNSARFKQALIGTPEFQDRFPGIFDKNGDLKMSPSQYMKQEQAYQNVADTAGINLGDNKQAWLFKNDVSAAEFQTRASAIARIRTNSDMFKAFGQQLAAEGLAPKGGLSKGDLFKFVLGEGNKEWYSSWNDTLSRYYGQQSGIAFGPGHPNKSYTNLGTKTVEAIGNKGLSETELSQGYQSLANQLTTTYPLSKIQKFGLSKQDLVELQFGGPRQASVAQKVQQILKNEQNIESAPKATLGNQNIGGGRTSQDRAQV